MTPNHVSPIYGLLLVSREEENMEACKRWSMEILSMPMRVVNNVVLKARKEAREYIQNEHVLINKVVETKLMKP